MSKQNPADFKFLQIFRSRYQCFHRSGNRCYGPYRLPFFRFIEYNYHEDMPPDELDEMYQVWVKSRFTDLFGYISAHPQLIQFKRDTISSFTGMALHMVEIHSSNYWVLYQLRKHFREDLLFLSYAIPDVLDFYNSKKYPGKLFPVHIFGADEAALCRYFPPKFRIDIPWFEKRDAATWVSKICKNYTIFSYMDNMVYFHTQEDYYNFQIVMKLSGGA